jgi:hypothetical protein
MGFKYGGTTIAFLNTPTVNLNLASRIEIPEQCESF